MQLQGDGVVTYKASKAALNKLVFGVNMLGSHFVQVTYTLIPADCESTHAADAYKQAWNGTKAAARRVLSQIESSLVSRRRLQDIHVHQETQAK